MQQPRLPEASVVSDIGATAPILHSLGVAAPVLGTHIHRPHARERTFLEQQRTSLRTASEPQAIGTERQPAPHPTRK